MKTGQTLIEEIAECSSMIEELSRFIANHGMTGNAYKAEEARLAMVERRKQLRIEMEQLPELTFS